MCPPQGTHRRDVAFALAVQPLLTNARESIQSYAKFHRDTRSLVFGPKVIRARGRSSHTRRRITDAGEQRCPGFEREISPGLRVSEAGFLAGSACFHF